MDEGSDFRLSSIMVFTAWLAFVAILLGAVFKVESIGREYITPALIILGIAIVVFSVLRAINPTVHPKDGEDS